MKSLFTELRSLSRYYKKKRNELAGAFCTATKNGEISLRNRELFDKFHLENTGIITINWDEVLWNDHEINNIIQLHGRCSVPESLVLPTELIIDDNIFRICEKYLFKDKPHIEQLSQYYRSKVVRDYLRDAHKVAIKWLEREKGLIIWGVAFNVYDAELISLFPPKPFNSLEEITIINTVGDDRDIAAAIAGKGVQIRRDINPITGKQIKICNEHFA